MLIVSFVEEFALTRFQFAGVVEGVPDQIGNVPIRERVVNVVAVAPTPNQAFAPQQPQPLRNRRKLLLHRSDDLRHAKFAGLQPFQDSQARSVAHRSKQLSRTL